MASWLAKSHTLLMNRYARIVYKNVIRYYIVADVLYYIISRPFRFSWSCKFMGCRHIKRWPKGTCPFLLEAYFDNLTKKSHSHTPTQPCYPNSSCDLVSEHVLGGNETLPCVKIPWRQRKKDDKSQSDSSLFPCQLSSLLTFQSVQPALNQWKNLRKTICERKTIRGGGLLLGQNLVFPGANLKPVPDFSCVLDFHWSHAFGYHSNCNPTPVKSVYTDIRIHLSRRHMHTHTNTWMNR